MVALQFNCLYLKDHLISLGTASLKQTHLDFLFYLVIYLILCVYIYVNIYLTTTLKILCFIFTSTLHFKTC